MKRYLRDTCEESLDDHMEELADGKDMYTALRYHKESEDRKSISTHQLLKYRQHLIWSKTKNSKKKGSERETNLLKRSPHTQGRRAPLWSLSSHLWLPQDNIFPQTRSHSCNPPYSSPTPTSPSSATTRLRPFLPELARAARGQQIRLHWCRPHARRVAHGLSHKMSSFSSILVLDLVESDDGDDFLLLLIYASWQAKLLVIDPHLHGRRISTEHGGQGPCGIWLCMDENKLD